MFTFTVYLGATLFVSVIAATNQQTCSPYPHAILKHGTIRRVDFQKYTFKCDKGYFLASFAKVRCYRGNWTYSKPPKCIKIQGQCGEPPAVKNAKIHGNHRQAGAKVKYMCEEGFTLWGHSELTCSQNGHWNKLAPTCVNDQEPLEDVAERLKSSFVEELSYHSLDTPLGRSLDKASLNLGLELYVLIDRSSSIDPRDLEYAKNFVKFLLRKFAVRNGIDNESGTRAAVLAFGTEVQTVIRIDDPEISNPQIAAEAVNSIQPNGGGTNMEGALTDVMVDTIKLRPQAKRALFMMTDGEPNIANPEITPQDIARQLKDVYNFEIFAVGIGRGIRTKILKEMASEPPISHVFMLEDYPVLDDVMRIIEDSKPATPPISKLQCGHNATGEDRPWMATLYIGGDPFKICSGVLICSQWVLTSASCLQDGGKQVDKRDVFIVFGERNLMTVDPGQTNFYAVDVHRHLSYDPNSRNIENNLALIKLNSPASPKYRPACLPPTDRVLPLHLDLKINASIAGWGMASASKSTSINDLTFDMHSSSVSLSEEQECPIRKRGVTPLCAGQGSKSCYGLPGSPLMAVDSSTGYQHVLGILVDRRHCARGQNQYVELMKYIGWVNHVTSHCQLKHWGLAK